MVARRLSAVKLDVGASRTTRPSRSTTIRSDTSNTCGNVCETKITDSPFSLAAQLLLDRIDGDTTAFETHVIPVNLIERGSGELEPRADLVRARLGRASN